MSYQVVALRANPTSVREDYKYEKKGATNLSLAIEPLQADEKCRSQPIHQAWLR